MSKTGYIIAMPRECAPLLEKAEISAVKRVMGKQVHIGTLCGKPFAVCVCGIGKVAAATGTEVNIINDRIENLPPQKFDVITSRALTSLKDLLKYFRANATSGSRKDWRRLRRGSRVRWRRETCSSRTRPARNVSRSCSAPRLAIWSARGRWRRQMRWRYRSPR